MLTVFETLDSIMRNIIIESKSNVLEVPVPVNPISKTNDGAIIIDIIKNAPKSLMTSEIIKAYAIKMGLTEKKVRPFVDGALNRMKGKSLEAYKEGKMQGSYYKIKAPKN